MHCPQRDGDLCILIGPEALNWIKLNLKNRLDYKILSPVPPSFATHRSVAPARPACYESWSSPETLNQCKCGRPRPLPHSWGMTSPSELHCRQPSIILSQSRNSLAVRGSFQLTSTFSANKSNRQKKILLKYEIITDINTLQLLCLSLLQLELVC